MKSPIEWAVIYSIVTGACEAGCRHFMDQRKLKMPIHYPRFWKKQKVRIIIQDLLRLWGS